LPVVHPVLGFKPKITLIGSLDTAVPEQLSDDALATLRESLSNVVPNAEADAGDVLVGVDTTAKTLTIQVEDNGVGIDPQVTPGGRNTAARARASGEHTTVVRRSEPGTTFTWVALPLEGSGSRSPSCGKPCSLRPLFSGAATGVRTLVRTRWTVGP
jgi:signal transduction histidine kinase